MTVYMILRWYGDDDYKWDRKYSRIFLDKSDAIRHFHELNQLDEIRGNLIFPLQQSFRIIGIPLYMYWDEDVMNDDRFEVVGPPVMFDRGDTTFIYPPDK